MQVSAEIITTLGAMVTMLLAVGGSMGWLLREMNRRSDQVDRKFEKIHEELDEIKHELTEVKISVARIEGTPPRFYAPTAR